jgi:hypothetical protein
MKKPIHDNLAIQVCTMVSHHRPTYGGSKQNHLSDRQALIRSEQCELCPNRIPLSEYEIHHTKYDGATHADLRIVWKEL